tara:strand:- start:1894 stop:2076 length:183 start_codon:yes stop_codon:yes gene_type:complete
MGCGPLPPPHASGVDAWPVEDPAGIRMAKMAKLVEIFQIARRPGANGRGPITLRPAVGLA